MSLLLALAACAPASSEPPVAVDEGILPGLCEASTIVPWQGGYLVGDNETLDRLFAFGPDLRPLPDVPLPGSIDDIEALAIDGDAVWIVGSQSVNKNGHERVLRERIGRLGAPATAPDLSACAPCVAARGIAPNSGGLNVEGAMKLDGALWLGLRAPLVEGRALLLRMTDTRVEAVTPIDLAGQGIRELVPFREGFLVIAGPVADADEPHALWWFSAPDAPGKKLDAVLPPGTEGLAIAADGSAVLVTDGDGKPGTRCATPARWKRIRVPADPPASP